MSASNSAFKLPTDLACTVDSEDRSRFAEEEALGMVRPDNSVLIKTASPVPLGEVSSQATRQVMAHLLEAASGQRRGRKRNKNRRTLVGLAAPQLGYPVRIIAIDTQIRPDRRNPGKLTCLINPEVIWRSRETAEDREGCFSTGPVWGLVRRPIAVKVRALSPEGNIVEHILEGFTARIAQHEIDHLDGIRFPERIRVDRKRHWVHTEELNDYPAHIHHWPRICTQAQWGALKQGQVELK